MQRILINPVEAGIILLIKIVSYKQHSTETQ